MKLLLVHILLNYINLSVLNCECPKSRKRTRKWALQRLKRERQGIIRKLKSSTVTSTALNIDLFDMHDQFDKNKWKK